MAKYLYASPALTVAAVEARVASYLNLSTADATTLARIDEAITVAGQEAVLWQNRPWSWARKRSSFDTVAATKSYALRTVNAAAMTDILAPVWLWWGTSHRLVPITKDEYDDNDVTTTSTGTSYWYALSGDAACYLWPTPSAVATVSVAYVQRHSKVEGGAAGSDDTVLIVPAEFHRRIYVEGAVWLLRHETLDAKSLYDCPAYVQGCRDMAAVEQTGYDEAFGSDSRYDPKFPPDVKHFTNASPLVLP